MEGNVLTVYGVERVSFIFTASQFIDDFDGFYRPFKGTQVHLAIIRWSVSRKQFSQAGIYFCITYGKFISCRIGSHCCGRIEFPGQFVP